MPFNYQRQNILSIHPSLLLSALAIFFLLEPNLCVRVYAQTETYHVAVDGSDASGEGSFDRPWATITHALDNAIDGSLILVGDGEYWGRVRLRGRFAQGVTVRAENPYRARLRHDETVATCYYGQGITLEGFDIAHDGEGASALVLQIQDLIGDAGGEDYVGRIVLRNNILHDSYNNDILKINNGAGDITVEGNIFYNQNGSDEHIDVNSVKNVEICENIFFNDFSGSGRVNQNDTSSFIVIKDSNGDSDSYVGSRDVFVRRNIFLNWEGSSGSNFVLVGEDGASHYEAFDVLVENNLMVGNSENVMRAPFSVKGGRNIIFRSNTVVGDLPSLAYAMRVIQEGDNPINDEIDFTNNIWSDPTGTMGAENPQRPNDFSDSPPGEIGYFNLQNNLYFNGGLSIPYSALEAINYTDDAAAVLDAPLLPDHGVIALPRWDPQSGLFGDGSSTIAEAFDNLVENFGALPVGSPAINAANPLYSPAEDILGNLRTTGGAPDIGAYESKVETREIIYVEKKGECGGKSICEITIQSAIEKAPEMGESIIKVAADPTAYAGLQLAEDKHAYLQGGWDSSFTEPAPTSVSTLSQPIELSSGRIQIENIVLK